MASRVQLLDARPPMVGRAEERARLHQAFATVSAEGSRFVLVGGDAGAGKTTLVEAFLADLNPGRGGARADVVRGQCVPLGGDGLPYAPVVGALRDLVARHGASQVLSWAGAGRQSLGTLLPDLVGAPEESDTIRLRLFEAIAAVWERASGQRPLVVVLEDLHWADESTQHLLRFLARALTDAAVLVVATYRTDELTRRHPLRPFLAEVGRFPTTVRVDVPSLDRTEVGELLARLLGRTPSRPVVDLVHRRSEGIPYFVEELATSANRGCIDMPDTLHDALNVRIQALSDATQETLRLIAVAGQHIDHPLLAAAAPCPAAELEARLREAVDAAVLGADETGYHFRHALLREVVHDDLLPGEHARLHAHFAGLLEERPELGSSAGAATEIAHHWSAAHEVNKAFAWSIRAATAASAAYPEALQMYEQALELWDRVADPEAVAGPRASVLERAASAAADAGEPERALALITACLDSEPAGDPVVRVKRVLIQAQLLATLMRPGSVAVMQQAVALLPDGAEPALRAKVLNQLAIKLGLAGDRRAAAATAATAMDLAVRAGAAGEESNARNTRGSSLVALGQEEAGLAELDRAGELARSETRTLLRYYINDSDALHLAGRYAAAVKQAEAGVGVARALGLERSFGAMLAGNTAEPLLALGDWSRADHTITRALELDPPAHHRAHLRLLQAWLRAWQGELDQADNILAEFRPMIDEEQLATQYTCHVMRTDAEHAMAVGNPSRAWHDATQYFRHWGLYPVSTAYPLLAVAAAAARRLDVADRGDDRATLVRAHLDQAEPIAIRAAWAPVVEAELADTPTAWQVAEEAAAADVAPAHLRPYAGLRRAGHLLAARDRDGARSVLAAAGERAEALGAGLLEARIGALAARAGLAPPARGNGHDPLGKLTAREREVLRLVAEGRSNGDIGAALFISTKTASVHVSNILAKLGVGGRGEAAAVAHRAGL